MSSSPSTPTLLWSHLASLPGMEELETRVLHQGGAARAHGHSSSQRGWGTMGSVTTHQGLLALRCVQKVVPPQG